ncbi:MAG TPA: N-6 DNA methylase [Alcaligenaceae bacterium]|nr:N-6 DNA methylase [Alcaligenaceae bacterium]
MTTYNEVNKKIDLLVSKSKFYSNKKQALDSIVGLLYNYCFTEETQTTFRNFPFIEVLKKPSNNFSYDEENSELLSDIIKNIIMIYKQSEPFTDVLTVLYGTTLKKDMGQHMTPSNLAFSLNKFIDNTEKDLKENNTISFYDPACGTGALALGKLRYVLKNYGKEAVERHDIFLCDIDEKMCIASAVNLELNCLMHNINYNQLMIYNTNSIHLYPEKKESNELIFLLLIPNFLKHRKLEKQKEAA